MEYACLDTPTVMQTLKAKPTSRGEMMRVLEDLSGLLTVAIKMSTNPEAIKLSTESGAVLMATDADEIADHDADGHLGMRVAGAFPIIHFGLGQTETRSNEQQRDSP